MKAALPTAQRLSLRTVHVKMYPTARNFQERREVLRVLERFGEVNVFRSLKYHPHAPVPNAFIAVFGSDSAAQALIDASPLRYRMINQSAPSSNPTESSPPSTEPANGSVDPASAETSKGATTENTVERVFEINVSKSIHDHDRYIREQPLFGPWKPVLPKSSFMSTSLTELLPNSSMRSGLADWVTASQKYRKEDIEEQMNVYRANNPSAFSLAFQKQERRRENITGLIPKVMQSLSDFSKNASADQQPESQKEDYNKE